MKRPHDTVEPGGNDAPCTKRHRVETHTQEELWWQINGLLHGPHAMLRGATEGPSVAVVNVLTELYRVLRDCWCFRGDPYDLFEPVCYLSDVTKRVLMISGGYVLTPGSQHLVLEGEANMADVGWLLVAVCRLLIALGQSHRLTPLEAATMKQPAEVRVVLLDWERVAGNVAEPMERLCLSLRLLLQSSSTGAVLLFSKCPLIEADVAVQRLAAQFDMVVVEPISSSLAQDGRPICLVHRALHDEAVGRVAMCGSWSTRQGCAQSFLLGPSGPLIIHMVRYQWVEEFAHNKSDNDSGTDVTLDDGSHDAALHEWLSGRLWTPQPTVVVQWRPSHAQLAPTADISFPTTHEVSYGCAVGRFERCRLQLAHDADGRLPAVWVRGLQLVSTVSAGVGCLVCRIGTGA